MAGGGQRFGESTVYAREAGFTEQYAYVAAGNGTGQIQYQGKAPAGTPTSSAFWQIRLFTYDSSNRIATITWAGGADGFDQVWDNRASLSYS